MAARRPESSSSYLLTMLLPASLYRLTMAFGLLGFSFIGANCDLIVYRVVEV